MYVLFVSVLFDVCAVYMCHLMCCLMYACAVGIYVLFDVCAV